MPHLQGLRIAAFGTTVLVNKAQKADAKSGTEKFGAGEELVTATPFVGDGKGKPISVFRMRQGRPALISDSSLSMITLKPDQQTLSFHGRILDDSSTLWDAGVRHDDTIMHEFASPTMPQKLQIVRGPDKPKSRGVKGKGKKKK